LPHDEGWKTPRNYKERGDSSMLKTAQSLIPLTDYGWLIVKAFFLVGAIVIVVYLNIM